MKKVKGMLAAIAILGVIGGAFAFKAKSAYGTSLFYNTTTFTTCAVGGAFTTTAAGQPHLGSAPVYYTFTASPTTCGTVSTFYTTHS